MKSSTLWSIIVGGILIGGIAFFVLRRDGDDASRVIAPLPTPSPVEGSGVFLRNAPEVSPDAMSMEKAVVSMTDTAISPSELTVKAGTAVTFVNNGTQPHWPASEPHPIHTDVPGFNAQRGLAPGESYSFTFEKVGTFGMHDHLHPNIKGVIVVQ